eukprot:1525358-Alexandrium_andersonii.AAC.1
MCIRDRGGASAHACASACARSGARERASARARTSACNVHMQALARVRSCLLYTSDAADDM